MNRTVCKTFQSLMPAVQTTLNVSRSRASALASCSHHTEKWNIAGVVFVPQRNLQRYIRAAQLAFRVRRKKEKFMFPERYSKPTPRSSFSDWNYNAEIFACAKRLGEQFDDTLLKEALTDQSYIHKERKRQEELGLDPELIQVRNNEELSQLGREQSEKFLKEFVKLEVPLFPAEGQSAVVKYLMSEETISNIAENLGFRDLILCEEYPPSKETYVRAFYGVIGALRSSTDEDRTQRFVIDFIAAMLWDKDLNDIWYIPRPWQMMTKIAQEKNLYPVEPRLIGQTGKNTVHAVFIVGIYDKDKKLIGTGIGESLDIAQEMAARDTLKGFFNTRDPRPPFHFQSENIPYKLVPHVHNVHLP